MRSYETNFDFTSNNLDVSKKIDMVICSSVSSKYGIGVVDQAIAFF